MPATPSTKPMATKPDAAQEYIDVLQDQLDKAKLELDNATADYNVKLSSFKNTLSWFEQLEIYCGAIDKTNKCAESLINMLDNAINQANLVGDDACYAVDAFRYMMKDIETVSKCTEALKIKVLKLGNQFPPLDAGDPIKKAYQALLDKINEAIKCITEALMMFLQTLQSLEVVWKGIATSPEKPGLAGYLEMVKSTFTTGELRKDYAACPGSACKDINFPLDDNNNSYYHETMSQCSTVEDDLYKTGGLRDKLEEAERVKNAKQNCYDALKAALDAALAARACKK